MAEHGLSQHFSYSLNQARRWEKLATLVLLLILLTIAVSGVTSVLSGPDWGSLWTSLLFGLLIGWTLAVFRKSAWHSAWIVTFTGIIYVFLFTGGLGGKLITVLAVLVHLAIPSAASPQGPTLDLVQLALLLQEFFASTAVIVERVQAWVVALAAGQSFFDPVAAALVWSVLVWIEAAWAGWVVEMRKNVLLAILPAILLSVGMLSYGGQVTVTVYLMLGLALILLATVQHDRREQAWDEVGVAYPAKKGQQIGRAAIIIALALVLISAFASWISSQHIVDWLSLMRRPVASQQGGLAKSLGIVAAVTPRPDVFEAVRHPGLPRQLLIGSGPELSRQLVMTVATEDLSPLSQGGQSLSLYWRSFTYDAYTGHGWRTSQTQENVYQANDPLQADRAQDHVLIQQEVNPVEGAGGTVYAAGEPVSINLATDAAWRSSNDLFGIRLNSAGSYTVRSLVPVIDEHALRAAGQKYPDWIRQRYLALPPDVPSRVKDLAIQLTASEPTPYDRAKAIEGYLRTYPYTLDVPRAPSERDLVDYFLFDLKKGYCDYYASAMVVLARAAGIPARLAIGYASGTYNINSKRFVVTQADAHSWVEVYFPEIGWVPFEPTASRPSLELSQQGVSKTPPAEALPEKNTDLGQTKILPWKKYLPIGGLGLILAMGVAWVVIDEIRLNRMSEPAAAVEVYRRLRTYTKRFRLIYESGITPYEYAALLTGWLQESEISDFDQDLLERIRLQVQSIIDRIVRTSYNPSWSEQFQGPAISHQWKVLRWRLGLLWALQKWISIRDRFIGLGWQIQRGNG